jgi:hypothetical protein
MTMRTIAKVSVGPCLSSVRTLDEWLVWRAEEDARMLKAIEAQLAEYFAAVAEKFERDANGELPH